VFRYTQGNKKRQVYKDSVFLGEDAAKAHLPTQNAPWRIGGLVDGLTFKFIGDIDELRVFSTGLSQAVITQHYNGPLRCAGAACAMGDDATTPW
jgi:hypothetical protein